MKYDKYRYLYPPRPERVIAPPHLDQIEQAGWWAEPKMNGTCVVLYVAPDGSTIVKGRHGDDEPIKSWAPGERWNAFVQSLPHAGWYAVEAELLHSKGNYRDTLFMHDLLVDNSQYLVGASYRDRWLRLLNLCQHFVANPVTTHTRMEFAPGIWLTQTYQDRFHERFKELTDPAVEGLVLKRPNASLVLCSQPGSNSNWQVKCRRPKSNLSF